MPFSNRTATARCFWPLALLMLASTGCAARAKREVLAANVRLQEALDAHDAAALRALAASDFQASTNYGPVDREQWIALVLRQHIVPGDGGPLHLIVSDCRTVDVLGRQRREAVGGTGVFDDRWVKRDRRWQLVRWQPVMFAWCSTRHCTAR